MFRSLVTALWWLWAGYRVQIWLSQHQSRSCLCYFMSALSVLRLPCETTGPSAPPRRLYICITLQLLIEHHHIFLTVAQNLQWLLAAPSARYIFFFVCDCFFLSFLKHTHMLKMSERQEIWFYGASNDMCWVRINPTLLSGLGADLCLVASQSFEKCVIHREVYWALFGLWFVITNSSYRNYNPIITQSWGILSFED